MRGGVIARSRPSTLSMQVCPKLEQTLPFPQESGTKQAPARNKLRPPIGLPVRRKKRVRSLPTVGSSAKEQWLVPFTWTPAKFPEAPNTAPRTARPNKHSAVTDATAIPTLTCVMPRRRPPCCSKDEFRVARVALYATHSLTVQDRNTKLTNPCRHIPIIINILESN